jgi:RCR-type E3 ubiquitin transferase
MEFMNPIRELEAEVRRKALARLDYDGQKDATIIETKYRGDPIAYAIDRYAYYICFKCKKVCIFCS